MFCGGPTPRQRVKKSPRRLQYYGLYLCANRRVAFQGRHQASQKEHKAHEHFPKSLPRRGLDGVILGLLLLAVVAQVSGSGGEQGLTRPRSPFRLCLAGSNLGRFSRQRGRGFEGGVAWLNTAGPITLKELRAGIASWSSISGRSAASIATFAVAPGDSRRSRKSTAGRGRRDPASTPPSSRRKGNESNVRT